MRRFNRKKINKSIDGVVEEVKNKKIKNAKKVEYDGIVFDSSLEHYVYKSLKENGIYFRFKPKYIILHNFVYDDVKIHQMTWTPDFDFPQLSLILDAKGFPNDTIKDKLKVFKYFNKEKPLVIWFWRNKAMVDIGIFLLKQIIKGNEKLDRHKDVYSFNVVFRAKGNKYSDKDNGTMLKRSKPKSF